MEWHLALKSTSMSCSTGGLLSRLSSWRELAISCVLHSTEHWKEVRTKLYWCDRFLMPFLIPFFAMLAECFHYRPRRSFCKPMCAFYSTSLSQLFSRAIKPSHLSPAPSVVIYSSEERAWSSREVLPKHIGHVLHLLFIQFVWMQMTPWSARPREQQAGSTSFCSK